jgi:hypothetical protein
MFASLPFILLLIIQGFARQDCAEFLCNSQDLVNIPVQARSLKAFDSLFAQFNLSGVDQKKNGKNTLKQQEDREEENPRFSFEGSTKLLVGSLKIQRSRDGPVG